LSYTTFKYGKATLSKEVLSAGETVTLTVPVKNIGKFDGDEVVQVYLKKDNDNDGPNKTLRAFKRIFIPAGETANVVFELAAENLEWWDTTTNAVHVHAGDYQLMVGNSSRNQDLEVVKLKIQKGEQL